MALDWQNTHIKFYENQPPDINAEREHINKQTEW
jgi:hypothetical protein